MLRDVGLGDEVVYVRMRCDPVMMAHLGGPLPREGIAAKVARDVREAAADESWIKMIVPDPVGAPGVVAGTVVLWSHEGDEGALSEIGWMVLPEFQGRGLAKRAVRVVLEQAREQGRWGVVHAFPARANEASNAICRSSGFEYVGEVEVPFGDRVLSSHHWRISPERDLV